MEIAAAIFAGLVATAAMTVLMYIAPMMGMPKMDMIGMTGTMLTPSRGLAYTGGTIFHFVMGVLFALFYAWLWSLGIGAPNWVWGLIFGAIHGVISIMIMPLMLRMHPRPPEMSMGAAMMIGILLAHLVYGVVVALTYASFLGPLDADLTG